MTIRRRQGEGWFEGVSLMPWLLVGVVVLAGVLLVVFVSLPVVAPVDGPDPSGSPEARVLAEPAVPPGAFQKPTARHEPSPSSETASTSPLESPESVFEPVEPNSDLATPEVKLNNGGQTSAEPNVRQTLPYGRGADSRRGTAHSDSAQMSAVDDGLRWLAAHQRRDGAWDRRHFDRMCPELDRCRETAVTMTKYNAEPAVTGLSLLAFVGAGHTHERGEFSDQVTIGLDFLLSRQLASGSFAVVDAFEMYNHAIATLALAEVYGMSRDPSLKAPLTAAVRHIIRAQQPGGGWGYTSEVATRRDDMSVSGWVVLALASARVAGVEVPDNTVLGIIDFVTDATYADGNVRYAREGERIIDNATAATSRRFGPAPTAIAMLIRQLLGWQGDAEVLTRHSEILLGELPDMDKFHGGDPSALHSAYYWYYGSLALFNQGGDAWRAWNEALRTALLESQDRSVNARGEKKHSFGSFPAFGPGWGRWGRVGGKVYSTALGVLTLETSYRRAPDYPSGTGLIGTSTLRKGLSDPDPQRQTMLATVVAQVHRDVGEPVFVDLLKHPHPRLRLRAAVGLARHGSPLGEPVLRQALPGSQGGELAAIQAALAKTESISWPKRYGLVVRVDQEHRVIVFQTDGEPVYIGQRVAVEHDGAPVAEARVTRRQSAHDLAAAEMVDSSASKAIVAPGDTVITPK